VGGIAPKLQLALDRSLPPSVGEACHEPYVSKLDCNTTREQLRAAFAVHGAVNAVSDRHQSIRNRREFIVQVSMLKTVGGSVWCEMKGTDSEKRLPAMDEGRVPDFFDHWMEEYVSKVAADDLDARAGGQDRSR
jgi:hypothetical protein